MTTEKSAEGRLPAVYEAIYDATHGVDSERIPIHRNDIHCLPCQAAADAAASVVLDQAAEQIKALPEGLRKGDVPLEGVLAVLAEMRGGGVLQDLGAAHIRGSATGANGL